MPKKRKLIIVGNTAFAEIAHEYFTHDSDYEVAAFSVESNFIKNDTLMGKPVLPFESIEQVLQPADHSVFVAVVYSQMNRLRTRLWRQAKLKGYSSASYVSSKAFVWRNVQLGEHCFVFENNVVQPFVKIGDNVILWSGNHIGHHSSIGNNCFISSHVVISGYVEVRENCFFGVNCSIANNLVVERDNWISPGVVILKSTPPNTLYPAPKTQPAEASALKYFRVDES